ncbi:hypothetical protein M885DRAFT_437465 [Pelagophyceae sp. CCMP2097]|nr:hypothetical protein M885DRAFT_437465 [Pelagophyceae sp. CCMP2097]
MDPGVKLVLCLLIDLVGVSSYALPVAGEVSDIAWAPVSAVLVQYLFGPGPFAILAFVEELVPGADFIPTATLAWFYENRNANANANDAPRPDARADDARRPPPQTTAVRKVPQSWKDGSIDV